MAKVYGVRVTVEPVNVTGPDAEQVVSEAVTLIEGVFADQGIITTSRDGVITATTTGMLAG